MPRKGYSPQFEDGRLNYFPVWIGDTLRHFTGELDYDTDILGVQVVLWCYSADQKPPGTLPNDPTRWARWTGKDAVWLTERMGVITSSWKLNDRNRWEIQRIITQADRAVDISSKRKAARANRNGTHDGTSDGTCVPTSVPDTISNARSNVLSNAGPNANVKKETGKEKSKSASKPARPRKAERSFDYDSSPDFCRFWQAYPKKKNKGDAFEIWQLMKPPIADVLQAISWMRQTDDWKRNGGQFIRMPTTALNQRFWEDEPPENLGKAYSEHSPTQRAMIDIVKEALGDTDEKEGMTEL